VTTVVDPSAQSGTVTGGGNFTTGNTAILTATAKTGCTFLRWENNSQAATRKILITDANVTVTAYFGATNDIAKPIVEKPEDQNAMVGVTFNLPLQITSASLPTVTVTGLPTGLKYDAATKSVSGVPTATALSKVVTITAKNANPTAAVQTFVMTVGPLPSWASGTFNGWCRLNDDFGAATMTVTAVGTVTGKLSAGATNCTFGASGYDPGSSPTVGFFVTVAGPAGKEVVPLIFAVDNCEFAEAPTLAMVEGKQGDDLVSVMYRNIWKDAGMATELSPYPGYYTAVLPGGKEYGSVYLAFTVDSAGGVKTAGKLADGTAVSLSGTLILDETGREFAVLYTSPTAYKGGGLFGMAEFVASKADDPVAEPGYRQPERRQAAELRPALPVVRVLVQMYEREDAHTVQ
jgi:hypothetical protein